MSGAIDEVGPISRSRSMPTAVRPTHDDPAKRYRGPSKPQGTQVQLDQKRLLTWCWCGAKEVHVPAIELRAGRTVCCKNPGCAVLRDRYLAQQIARVDR